MQTLSFLLSTLIELYTMVLILRIWLQWSRCDFYNPFSQFIVRMTHRLVSPLRRVIPAIGPIDSASLLIAVLLTFIKAAMLLSVVGLFSDSATFLAQLPPVILFTVFILLKTFGMLIFWLLFLMAIISWINRGYHPIQVSLGQLTDPLLRPIRRLLPAMGGIDFSPMLLVLLLYVINMAISELLANYGSLLWQSLWRIA